MTKTVKGMLIFALAAFCASLTFPLVASALDNEAVFRGTVRVGREVIPDVTVSIVDDAGTEVGSVASGDDGKWAIPIPYIGEFTVQLLSLIHI